MKKYCSFTVYLEDLDQEKNKKETEIQSIQEAFQKFRRKRQVRWSVSNLEWGTEFSNLWYSLYDKPYNKNATMTGEWFLALVSNMLIAELRYFPPSTRWDFMVFFSCIFVNFKTIAVLRRCFHSKLFLGLPFKQLLSVHYQIYSNGNLGIGPTSVHKGLHMNTQ